MEQLNPLKKVWDLSFLSTLGFPVLSNGIFGGAELDENERSRSLTKWEAQKYFFWIFGYLVNDWDIKALPLGPSLW